MGAEELDALVHRADPADPDVMPPGAAPFFRVHRIGAGRQVEPGFAVVLVTEGAGHLVAGTGALALTRGAAAVVPFAAGPWHLDGDGAAGEIVALVGRPPLP
jgi:mannose-6-phosphate isomerase